MPATPPPQSLRYTSYWLLAIVAFIATIALCASQFFPGLSTAEAASVSPQLPAAAPGGGCQPNWSMVNTPNPRTHHYLNAIDVITPNDVWAVGEYYSDQNYTPDTGLAMHWDGVQWTIVPTPPLGKRVQFNGVAAVASNDVWAVGVYYPGGAYQPIAMHWDGTAWSIVTTPTQSGGLALNAVVAIAADDVWAVGANDGSHSTITMHWNGSYWAIVPSPNGGGFSDDNVLTAVDAVAPNDVWAVGYIYPKGGTQRTLALHWDGTAWTLVTTPNPGNYVRTLYGVTAIASNDVWAVGSYSYDSGSSNQPLFLHWNGTTWTHVTSPDIPDYNALRSIDAISPTDIWAVGTNAACDLCDFETLIMHWDGTSWTRVYSPNGFRTFSRLYGVEAVSAGDIWAVGFSDDSAYPYNSDSLALRQLCPAPPTVTGTPPTATRTATVQPSATPTACSASNSNYTVTASSGAAVVPATTDVGLHCDDCETTINLPFTFLLYGQPFNSAILGSNGTMGFVANSNAWLVTCMPSQEFNYAILPYWQSLHLNNQGGGCPGCGIFTSVEGAAPNRVFNIEWRARDYFYTALVNVEVRLYEGNSTFEIIYGSVPSGGDQQVTVGVQKDLGTQYTQYVCENTFGTIANGTKLTFSQPACGTVTATPTSMPGSTGTPITPTNTQVATGTATRSSTATQVQGTQTTLASTQTATMVASPAASGTPIVATATSTACTIQFSDVPEGHTFYAQVRCLACQGVLGGYNDGTFRPDNLITRGQIAKVIANAAGFDEDPGAQIYEDVDQSNPFYTWINRLSMRGHMGGYPCGTVPEEPCNPPENRPYFRPFANATRGQIAKIVSNAAGFSDTPPSQTFEDVPLDHSFYTWIERLASRGYMSGYPCGGGEGEPCGPESRPYFRPYNNATRGQTSKIVANAFFPGCTARR